MTHVTSDVTTVTTKKMADDKDARRFYVALFF